jgi:hypothetical protein
MLRSVVAVLAIGAIASLGACSNDDSSSSTDTTGATTASTAAATTTTGGAPCGGTATVEAAVRGSSVAGLGEVSEKYDVSGVQVSASDPTWGRFQDVSKPGVTDFQGGYGVVHCESGTWVVYDAGSAGVGCGGGAIAAVPPAVRSDLGLVCPGT